MNEWLGGEAGGGVGVESDSVLHQDREHIKTGRVRSSEFSFRNFVGDELQYSCLENSIDRGAWQVTIHGVTKSQIYNS